MKRTILLLCVVSVLSWTAGSVLAQGKGKQREDRTANKANENAAAAEKKATTPQDVEKAAKEKGKGAVDQAQTRGKAAKDQAKDKMADAKDKAAEAKGKGKDQAQQLRAIEKQIQHETAKHLEREARLARIKELAVKKGDTKMVEQVDQLIAKEKQFYEAKLQKMQAQKRAGGTVPPTDVTKPKGGKSKDKKGTEDVAKPAEKPAEQAPTEVPSTAGGQGTPAPEKPAETPKPPTPEPNAPKPQ